MVDTYDAITTERVYNPARPHEEAIRIISEEKGEQFDPDVVEAFLAQAEAVQAIREKNQG